MKDKIGNGLFMENIIQNLLFNNDMLENAVFTKNMKKKFTLLWKINVKFAFYEIYKWKYKWHMRKTYLKITFYESRNGKCVFLRKKMCFKWCKMTFYERSARSLWKTKWRMCFFMKDIFQNELLNKDTLENDVFTNGMRVN